MDNKRIAFIAHNKKKVQPHDADIESLIRACVLKGVPLGLTPEHAEITLKGLQQVSN